MRHSLLTLCGLALCFTSLSGQLDAADSPSAKVEKAVASFEKALDSAFKAGRSTLDRFQKDHKTSATKAINEALNQSQDPNDQLWLAWHLLFLNPKHHGAKKIFGEHDKEVPLDLLGNFNPSEPPVAPSNIELVLLVHKILQIMAKSSLRLPQPLNAIAAKIVLLRNPLIGIWKVSGRRGLPAW